jgi:hypothetical protein
MAEQETKIYCHGERANRKVWLEQKGARFRGEKSYSWEIKQRSNIEGQLVTCPACYFKASKSTGKLQEYYKK